LVYPRDRAAYGRLCQLLTHGKRGDETDRVEKANVICGLMTAGIREGQLLIPDAAASV